jgi:hypothetical protein
MTYPRHQQSAAAQALAIDARTTLRRLMLATLADEKTRHTWTYHAVRPMPVPPAWHPGQLVIGDCSKGVQYLCRWANSVPDPMAGGFGRYGNSSTLAAHLEHRDHPSELQVGDIITFGPGGSDHAAMVIEADPEHGDPLLWSFGHQGAPNTYRLSHDRRERQYLRLHLPEHKPTATEKLQAKTGYWAWLQWRLGEGAWRTHKPCDPKVRPNVPLRIPSSWWKQYTVFILNRRRGNTPTTQ